MRCFILELVQSQLRFRGPKGMTIAMLDFATFTEGAMVATMRTGLQTGFASALGLLCASPRSAPTTWVWARLKRGLVHEYMKWPIDRRETASAHEHIAWITPR